MEEIREITPPSQMERVRATRVYLESRPMTDERRREVELDAFMAIFHPDRKRGAA